MATYLKPRGKQWYFQIRVPEDVRQHFNGDPLIVRPLDTTDRKVAEAKAKGMAGRFKLEFEAHRGSRDAQSELDRVTYEEAYHRFRRERPDKRVTARYYAEDISKHVEETEADLLADHHEAEARALGWRDEDEDVPPAVAAKVDALRDAAEGTFKVRRETFATVNAKYLKDVQPHITGQTYLQQEATFRLFDSFRPDTPLSEITREDVREFFSQLRSLAPAWGRKPNTKELSFADLVATFGATGRGLSDKTLLRHASALSSMWKWAAENKYVKKGQDNPFTLVLPKAARDRMRKKKDEFYQPMTVDELNKVLAALEPHPWLREITLVALYSGMRANEICSLTWENIRQEDGVWFFDITAAKSEAGVRPVPVHDKLAWLLERRRGVNDLTARIWPMLKPDKVDGKFSSYPSKRFGHFKRAVGIADSKKVFHSLRKNAVQCLARAKVPQHDAAEIVGHEKEGITYSVYNPQGMTMRQRKEVVDLIQYPGLAA